MGLQKKKKKKHLFNHFSGNCGSLTNGHIILVQRMSVIFVHLEVNHLPLNATSDIQCHLLSNYCYFPVVEVQG